MTMMLPLRRGFPWSQTDAPRADELFVARTALNLARYFGRTGQMIDQRRMPNRRLCCLKRTFLKDGGVKRTPAHILAVRDQAVTRPERPSMCFANRKNRVRRTKCKHSLTRTVK